MTRPLVIPGAPSIPGLTFRLFDPAADYAPMVDVLNVVAEEDNLGLGSAFTVTRLVRMDAMADGFDPSASRFVAEVDGRMIGVATIHRCPMSDGTINLYHTFDLLRKWRGLGIGRAALKQCQSMLIERAGRQESLDNTFFSSYGVSDTQPQTIAVLLRDGYQPFRHMYRMVRPTLDNIPNVAPRSGIEIRPLDMRRLRQVWESIQSAFRSAWGFVEPHEGAFESWAKDNEPLRPALSRIAWAGDQVAGTVLIFIHEADNQKRNRKRAFTETITVGKPWRRRGLARSLLASALRSIRDAGMTEAALSVDTQNASGALSLYESMGYQVERRTTTFRKGFANPTA